VTADYNKVTRNYKQLWFTSYIILYGDLKLFRHFAWYCIVTPDCFPSLFLQHHVTRTPLSLKQRRFVECAISLFLPSPKCLHHTLLLDSMRTVLRVPDDYERRLRATNLFTASTEEFYDALYSLKTFPKTYFFYILRDTIAVTHFCVLLWVVYYIQELTLSCIPRKCKQLH
jgi:hypothetical protein